MKNKRLCDCEHDIFVVYPKSLSLSGLLAVLGGRIQVEAKKLEWE
jgi:hypothetical protein